LNGDRVSKDPEAASFHLVGYIIAKWPPGKEKNYKPALQSGKRTLDLK
jgi:hypothetical protein